MAQKNNPIEELSAAYKSYGAGKITKADLDAAIVTYKKTFKAEDQSTAESNVKWLLKTWIPTYHKYNNDTKENPAELKEKASKKPTKFSAIDTLRIKYKVYGAGKIKKADLDKALASYIKGSKNTKAAEKDVSWLLASFVPTWTKYNAESK
jgi:hypothetical protein